MNPTVQSVLWVLAAVVTVGAAWKAALYIGEQMNTGWKWVVRRKQIRQALTDIASADEWPNGSKTLPESHRNLYDGMKQIKGQVRDTQSSLRQVKKDLATIRDTHAHNSESIDTIKLNVRDIQQALETLLDQHREQAG